MEMPQAIAMPATRPMARAAKGWTKPGAVDDGWFRE
jgi:hypothetical protein